MKIPYLVKKTPRSGKNIRYQKSFLSVQHCEAKKSSFWRKRSKLG